LKRETLLREVMFIQTEDTPNPATMKFLPGQPVAGTRGGVDFPSREDSGASALARRLFAIDGVERVYMGVDFVSVTKTSAADWEYLRTLVLAAIMEHYVSGLPVFDDEAADGEDEESDPVIRQIKAVLDTRVRPAVAQDGGDITFDRFEDGILYLHLQGACSGCPSSTATLKGGVENMMRHYVPEVQEVRTAGLYEG
jgi:Fe-S cluster biogenesis protein NfuA